MNPELERFIAVVANDDTLFASLSGKDRGDFVAAVVAAGCDLGCKFTPADVETVLQSKRAEWVHRWI